MVLKIESLTKDPQAALIVVDMQADFYPGGPLGVAEGDQIVEPISKLMNEFDNVVCSQDSHLMKHISFASSHGMKAFEILSFENLEEVSKKSVFSKEEIGAYLESVDGHQQRLWPDHCVQNTEGWKLDERLPLAKVDLILRKGTNPKVDSYSAFFENDGSSTGLAGYLRERKIERVLCVGLAGDYCVFWTVQDARRAGFEVYFDPKLTRSVHFPEGSEERAYSQLKELGVYFL